MNSITSMLNNANLKTQFKMKNDKSNVVKNILNYKTENSIRHPLIQPYANDEIQMIFSDDSSKLAKSIRDRLLKQMDVINDKQMGVINDKQMGVINDKQNKQRRLRLPHLFYL